MERTDHQEVSPGGEVIQIGRYQIVNLPERISIGLL